MNNGDCNLDLEDIYYIQPNIHCPQYSSFVKAESTSLIALLVHPSPPPPHEVLTSHAHVLNEIDMSNEKMFPNSVKLPKSISEHVIFAIGQRAQSFLFWKELCCSKTLENLNQQLKSSIYQHMPRNFILDIFSYGRKLSTRQRRRVVMAASLGVSEKLNGCHYFKLGLFLDHDDSRCDEFGVKGVLRRVCLCVQVDEYWNNDLKPVSLSTSLSQPSLSPVSDDLSTYNEDICMETNAITLKPKNTNTSLEAEPSDTLSISTNTTTATTSNTNNTVMFSTPLRSVLCKIICNMGLVTTGSFVCDPFCGSGSLLHMASSLGAVCIGCDVCPVTVTVTAKDQQHTRASGCIEYCQANIYHQTLYSGASGGSSGLFDVIICDPPYGRRERHVDVRGVDSARHQSPGERARDRFRVLEPLMTFASEQLRRGGRLVFLFAK